MDRTGRHYVKWKQGTEKQISCFYSDIEAKKVDLTEVEHKIVIIRG
jgi:hypothetical protein